jgi:hypothetical protein
VGGKRVATLELLAPPTQNFVVRGTVPVPKGSYPRLDGLEPFSIQDWDGTVVPTQVESVSLYPNDANGADVVEVLARVAMPPGTVADTILRYAVVEDPHPEGSLPLQDDVMQLITNPGMVFVVAEDCFGHEYTLDLFADVATSLAQPADTRLLRAGEAAVSYRTYGTLRSSAAVGPPSGALEHLFGVHAYATAWGWTDSVSLDLRVNNGASGRDEGTLEDDPLGKVYFRSLELWVPAGWTVVTDVKDPFFGGTRSVGGWTAHELVAPLPAGALHMMPAWSSFHRRLALTKLGNQLEAQSVVDEKWLAYARRGPAPAGGELYSWWNHQTPAYYPQRHRLPELDYLGLGAVRNVLSGRFNASRNVLTSGAATGAYPYQADVFGWAHPWGVPYGGMTSGSEIFLYDGFLVAEAAEQRGYKHLQHAHRMYVSRQPDKIYDRDGEPTALEGWLLNNAQGPYVNMKFYQGLQSGSPDPFGVSTSAGFQRNHVENTGRAPAYEAALLGYSPIDFQHYVRFTRAPKTLVWLGNDLLAKDDLLAAAEIFRLSYHEHPVSPFGATINSGYLYDKQFVETNPGLGFHFGRGESWGIDSTLAAYSTGDAAYRATLRPWFEQIADTIALGQSPCNGIVQAHVNNKWVGGKYRARQSIEQAITEHMLYGLIESVFQDVDLGRTAALDFTLAQSTQAMIGPMCWSTGTNGGIGPHSAIAVGPLNLIEQPFCGSLPNNGSGNGIDKYQIWSSFAYGLEKTGNGLFLGHASQLAGGSGTLWDRMVAMGFNNLENRMALLADLQ